MLLVYVCQVSCCLTGYEAIILIFQSISLYGNMQYISLEIKNGIQSCMSRDNGV